MFQFNSGVVKIADKSLKKFKYGKGSIILCN